MKKRMWSILLALTLALSLLPMPAMADGEGVAQAGDAIYATLAEAFANADGKTVKLLDDVYLDNVIEIPEGKTITLDLNGNDITVYKDESTGRSLYAINNSGEFTLLDSVGGGSITARGIQNLGNGVMTIESGEIIACDANGGGAIWNEATLTVNGGTFKTTHVGTPSDQYGPCCLNTQGTTLITGGTFESVNRRAYAIISTGILTITPSEGKEVTVSGAHGGLAIDSGTAVVNGGSYSSTEYYGLYVSNDGMGLDPMTAAVTVNDGTFEGKSYSVWVGSDYNNPVNSSVAVYGGVFKNPLNAQSNTRENAIIVYGGSFSSQPDAKYIADGYETALRGDQWVVGTADELAVAEVNNQKYPTLTAALDAAADGQTVKLLADSTGNTAATISDGRKLTLDMNGFDAGFALKQNISIYHGGLDIIGSGKLYEENPYYAPVMLYGSESDVADYSTVTVGKDVTLEGWAGLFIDQHDDHGATAYGIKATVYGTLHSVKDIDGYGGHALYINGTISATEGNVPEIILNGATLNTDLGNGMYLAGYAETTITNTSITADTGIEIRAGKLTVNEGSVITATAVPTSVTPNGNGSTTDGAGIAVAQHTTKLPIEVTIAGGTIKGFSALYESNPQNNEEEAIAKVAIEVTGGNFQAINGGTVSVYSENKTGFISGGNFTSDPSAYLAADKVAVESTVPGYNYTVAEKQENTAEVVPAAPAVAEPNLPEASEEEKNLAESVKEALTNTASGAVAPSISSEVLNAAAKTEANQNTVTEEEGETELDKAQINTAGETVTIVIQPYMDIVITDASIDGADKTITLDITPMYRTVATTADLSHGENIVLSGTPGANAVQIGQAKELTITKPVTVTVPLPADFAAGKTLYIKHIKDNGKTYYYTGAVNNDVLTFTNPHSFSNFTIMSNSEAVAEINNVGYATLQEAVNDVPDNGTIKLLRDGLHATVSRTISFTVDSGSYTCTLVPGTGYSMSQSGNTYTFTYVGTPVDPVDPSTPVTGGDEADGDYAVTVDRTTGGKVTVNPGRADKGDTVTITAIPNDGYVVDEVTVNGVTNGVKYLGDNKYSFTMPGSSAKVSVTFVKDGTQTGFPFTDVSESFWARSEIEWAYENGYVNGSTATTFNPNGTITRQQVWMILARIAGENPANMAEAKAWAVANGVSDGSNPGGSVTRQQLVTILFRFAGQNGYDTSARADLSGYPDVATVESYATDAMAWAVAEGIISGTTQGTLNPAGTASRAQFAVILYRYMA